MLDVFAEVIAPVLLAALAGGWVCRRLGIGAPVVSRLSFFLFSPCLVFTTMSAIELGGSQTAKIVAVTAGGALVTTLLGLAVAGLLREDRRTRAAMGLTAGMANSGNLGLPVSALAFGQPGLDIAVVGFVTSAFVVNTLGVGVAASGSGGIRQAVASVVRVPSLWAAVIAFAVNALDVDLPALVSESVGTLGDAAVPVMLVVLGVQLTPAATGGALAPVSVSTVARLVGGPLAAWMLATILDLPDFTRDTLIVLGGMPTAVYTTILATEYRIRPPLVTSTVVVTTLASVATLTVLIAQYR